MKAPAAESPRHPSAAPRCDAGIVFAVPIEADAFARLAADRVEIRAAAVTIEVGVVAGRRVAWCASGVGAAAATAATRLLVDGHRPTVVISAGFAGALDAALPRGSVVRPLRSVAEADLRPIPLWTPDGAAAEPCAATILTVDRVVATAEAKRCLAAASGANLVDMETHAVATVARAAGLPCAAVRVISDDATEDLPREIAALAAPQSALRRLGAAFNAVGRRPRAAIDLWRLWEHAVVDGRTLATALAELLQSLPGSA